MAETTAELDTKQEEASPNGYDEKWQSFDTNDALLKHILANKPSEELVDIPEWNVQLLCKTLDAAGRLTVESKAYDKDATLKSDYRRCFDQVVIHGAFNPKTNKPFFKEEHSEFLKASGGPTVRLAMVILRLSAMLPGDAESTKKN